MKKTTAGDKFLIKRKKKPYRYLSCVMLNAKRLVDYPNEINSVPTVRIVFQIVLGNLYTNLKPLDVNFDRYSRFRCIGTFRNYYPGQL